LKQAITEVLNSLFLKLAQDYYRGCSKLPGKEVPNGPTCPHGKTFLGVSKKENENKGNELRVIKGNVCRQAVLFLFCKEREGWVWVL
jgi:hypothetical protein